MSEVIDAAVALALDARCSVAECPVWDEANDRVLFTDIPAARIHSFGLRDGRTETWDMPDVVGSFGLCRSGRLVVAMRDRVVLFDPETEALTSLAMLDHQDDGMRFNDGKVGPDGCFWVGEADDTPAKRPIARLFRVRPDGVIEEKAGGYNTSNGLAWSPDGTVLFHSDSRQQRIDRWRFDPATGAMSDRTTIATPSAEIGRPDGGATDAEGCYWSAGLGAGALNRFGSDGTLLARVMLPVPFPTMPCFAGGQLFVTTLREGRDSATLAEYPTLGGLFRLPAPVRGAPVGLFADT